METSSQGEEQDKFVEIELPFLERNLSRVMQRRKRSASPSSAEDKEELSISTHEEEPEMAGQDDAMRLDPPSVETAEPSPPRPLPFLLRSITRTSRLCRRAEETHRKRKGRRRAGEPACWYAHIHQKSEDECPKIMTTKKMDCSQCFQCPLCNRFSSSSVMVSCFRLCFNL